MPYKPCSKGILDFQLPNQLSFELFPSDNRTKVAVELRAMDTVLINKPHVTTAGKYVYSIQNRARTGVISPTTSNHSNSKYNF